MFGMFNVAVWMKREEAESSKESKLNRSLIGNLFTLFFQFVLVRCVDPTLMYLRLLRCK